MTGKDGTANLVAGYGAVDITPPVGEFCSFRLAPNKRSLGVHDRLHVHAVYLANGDAQLLLVSVDTVALVERIVREAKSAISDRTDVPVSHILVAATHTHNGAELLGEEPFANISRQVARVVDGAARAARTAIDEKFRARIGWGHVELPGVAKNRFQNRLDGGNVDLVDDRLDFLKFEDADGNHRGILWHFAAHPTAAMKAEYLSSADYYGIANAAIVERLGGFSVFFNGACGNVNPVLDERSFEKAKRIGLQVASPLIQCVPRTKAAGVACLAVEETRIDIPLTTKRTTLERPDDRDAILAYFREIGERAIAPEDYDREWPAYNALRASWWRHKLLDEFSDTESESMPLQGARILDHVILTVPGEIFVEFQLALQESFVGNRAMIFGYANGYVGYIPDPESFEHDFYETNPSFVHRAGKHAGTKILAAGEELVRRILET